MTIARELQPARLLEGLNDAQVAAVRITSGPLAIIAGAGSGKTRVISHRAAHAIETGVVAADRVLLVTFTDKAATEMVERMAALGHRRVMARTFHAMALTQLRHFWPSRHNGAPLPRIVEGKGTLLYPLATRLPGGYKFTQVKDLAEAIEWAKVRRIRPEQWVDEGGEKAPIPADLFAGLYAEYERTKTRAGLIDFEDMLVETVDLLETDEAARALVHARKTWFSVDEYQDTNPIAERLIHLWLGASRDLAVVGDPDQTIYTFTGATPEYLLEFEARHPGAQVVALVDNYRSTPQILELANRLMPAGPRGPLKATRPSGPAPTIRAFPDDRAEREGIIEGIRGLLGGGTAAGEIAILVRINAQLPELEQALTRGGIPFTIRGQRFFDRREVKDARRVLVSGKLEATGAALAGALRELFVANLGLGGAEGEAADRAGDEAAERSASLETLLSIVGDMAEAEPRLTRADVVAELERRDAAEASGVAGGVNLLTYHRAKGLEWDAVFLPALEEGLMPIRQAKEDAEVDEERRLLYVGITRARSHLGLSWAQGRASAPGSKPAKRGRSRFLISVERGRTVERRLVQIAAEGPPDEPTAAMRDGPLLEALQLWRRDRARADAVPAYVVAHDATLFAIAEDRPRTLAALRRIRGMGPLKLESYGDELLAIVARAASPATPGANDG